MPQSFPVFAPSDFADAVRCFPWRRSVLRVDVHHTQVPDHGSIERSGMAGAISTMRHTHIARGLDDIAQHVTIAPDGAIWTGRDWNETPASVGYGMNANAFMIELAGDFDTGRDRLEGRQLSSLLVAIDVVQRQFHLPPFSLLFHRDVPQAEQSCPGTSISKPHILRRLVEMRQQPAARYGSDGREQMRAGRGVLSRA